INKNITVLTRNEGWKKPREGWIKCNSMLLIKHVTKDMANSLELEWGRSMATTKKLGA
ncbi:hypothetical protein ISN45_Aa08g027570, partial [Arabidopsis thaliana x Arabidopsis arenosa]